MDPAFPNPDGAPQADDAQPHDRAIEDLLNRIAIGEKDAASQLLPLVYDHLRAIARARMATENPGHTLQPTALVNEAYIKLIRGDRSWNDKRHFFAAAALAMRQILVDRARAKRGEKRGGGLERISLSEVERRSEKTADTPGGGGEPEAGLDWLVLESALTALEAQDPGLSEIVHLRYLAGLTIEETAMALGVSTRTVNREWTVARAWLLRHLRNTNG